MHFHIEFGNFGSLGLQQQNLTRNSVYKIKTRFLLTRTLVRRMKTKLWDSEESRIVWILQEFYSIWNNKINKIPKQQNLTKNKRPKHII